MSEKTQQTGKYKLAICADCGEAYPYIKLLKYRLCPKCKAKVTKKVKTVILRGRIIEKRGNVPISSTATCRGRY